MQPTYPNYNNILIPQAPQNYPPYQYQTVLSRVNQPYQYTYPNSLQHSMISKRQPNKWNLNHDNQANVNNFPYGKEREKMYHYVSKQMQSSIDEENKKILQKFRIDAIKNRNQRVMKHLGKVPYLTESMLPGTSLDPSKFVQKPPIQPAPIYRPVILSRIQPPQQIYIPVSFSEKSEQKKIITPRKINKSSSSIGVSVDFEQQFPLRKKQKRKKRYYTIEQQEQETAMSKIEDMLHQINVKLKRNTQLLSKSTIQNQSLAVSRIVPQSLPQKPSYSRRKYFQNGIRDQESVFPTIKYSGSHLSQKKRSKTVNTENESSLKQHLSLIKRNRKRLQDLDEYIYR